jgi:hypothetical protein
LKQGLRRCNDFWNNLKGEIDFDDLLVMSLVRESEPDFFSLIEKYIDYLCLPLHSDGRSAKKEEFENALDRTQFRYLRIDQAKAILEFIFEASDSDKPQGIKQREGVDYWERFLAEPEIEINNRDQTILKIISSENEQELLKILQNVNQVDKVEHFNNAISDEQIKRLFVPLIQRSSQEDPSIWGDDQPTGFISLWRIWLKRKRQGKFTAQELLEHIKSALAIVVPKNLQLGADINYYFIDGFQHKGNGILSDSTGECHQEAKRYLHKLLCDNLVGQPSVLASAFRGARPATLLQICYNLERQDKGEITSVPFSAWDKLADTLLEAAHLSPKEVIPQIAVLIVSGGTRFSQGGITHEYVFNPSMATLLFGNDQKVKNLFADVDVGTWEDENIKTMIRAVQDA